MVEIEQRNITGRGTLRVPFDNPDIEKAKRLFLFCSVFREPRQAYWNETINPPRSFFANIVARRKGRVLSAFKCEFKEQQWSWEAEPYLQNMYAVQCAYEGILKSFVNLGMALGAIPISVQDNIRDWKHTILFPDEFLFVCYSSTAIQVTLEAELFQICVYQNEKPPLLPPEPPAPPPPIPPEQPLEPTNPLAPSPDYNDPPSDPGDYKPYPEDIPPPPPPEVLDCTLWRVVVRYRTSDRPSSSPDETLTALVRGNPGAPYGEGNKIFIPAFGYSGPLGSGFVEACALPKRPIKLNQTVPGVTFTVVTLVSKERVP